MSKAVLNPFTGELQLINEDGGGGSSTIGATGVRGPTGPAGAGYTGLQGATGLEGPVGPTGPQGQGVTGLQGIQGQTGIAGPIGNDGVQGLQGATGVQGIAGSQGSTGVGIQGQTGVQGVAGGSGSQGVTGIQGQTGLGIQGATGLQGTAGSAGIQGVTGASIQGSTGVQGIQGQTGIQGNNGIQGSTGVQGNQGLQGNDGAQGIQGITGLRGVTGLQGLTGLGTQGSTGAGIQGQTGIAGSTGPQGLTGITGATGPSGGGGSTVYISKTIQKSRNNWVACSAGPSAGGQEVSFSHTDGFRPLVVNDSSVEQTIINAESTGSFNSLHINPVDEAIYCATATTNKFIKLHRRVNSPIIWSVLPTSFVTTTDIACSKTGVIYGFGTASSNSILAKINEFTGANSYSTAVTGTATRSNGMDIDEAGLIYTATTAGVLQQWTDTGSSFTSNWSTSSLGTNCRVVAGSGSYVFTYDEDGLMRRIAKSTGTATTILSVAATARVMGMAVDASDYVYVYRRATGLHKYDSSGTQQWTVNFNSSSTNAHSVEIDPDGYIYLSEALNSSSGKIFKIHPSGVLMHSRTVGYTPSFGALSLLTGRNRFWGLTY